MVSDISKRTQFFSQIVFLSLIALIGLSFSLQNSSNMGIESTIQSDLDTNFAIPQNAAGTTYDFSLNFNERMTDSNWETYWTFTPINFNDNCDHDGWNGIWLDTTRTMNTIAYTNLTRNLNLANYNITNALLQIHWFGNFTDNQCEAVWCIDRNGVETEISTTKQNIGTWGTFFVPEILNIDITPFITGSETNIQIRLKSRLINQDGSHPSYIDIQSFQIGVFSSTIIDSGNFIDLNQNYTIYVNIARNGTSSNLQDDPSYYKMYFEYGTTAQAVTTSDISTAPINWSGYTSDRVTMAFQIGSGNFTYNGILTFRLFIDDGDFASKYYFSPTYSASIRDGWGPKFDGTQIYYNGTTNTNYIRYDCDLNLTFPVNDTGGLGLTHGILYWKTNGPVYDTNYDDYRTYSFTPAVNKGNLTFILPELALNASITTNILVRIYDGSENYTENTFPLALVRDYVDPEASFVSSSPSSHNIQYNGTLTLTYQIIEDFDGRGLLDSNAVELRWKVAHNSIVEAPMDENDHDGSYSFQYGYNAYDRTFAFYLPLYEHFQYNDTVYFWVMATDKSFNVGNSTFNELYYINDTAAPICNPVGNTVSPAGYNEDKALTFQITEIYNTKAAGANVSYSRENSYLKINNTGANIKLNFTDSGDQIMTTIQKSLFHYTDTLYLYIQVKDYANNSISRNFTIYVADIYAPIISVLTDYAHTNITYARTNYDLLFAVDAADFPGGSNLKNVSLKINFDAAVNWNAVSTTYLYQTVSGSQFSFVIPSNVLVISSGTSRVLHYTFRAFDNDGNLLDINGSVNILKQGTPGTPYVDLGGRLESYFNSRTWNLTTRLDTDCIVNIFVDGQQVNDIPYSGKNIVHLMSFPADGSYNITIRYFNQSWSKIVVIDTIAPAVVDVSTVRCVYENGGINITWSPSASDVYIYYVFRGTTENFALSDGIRIIDVTECHYLDTDVGPGIYYYRIVAVDRALNLAEGSTSVKCEVPLPAYTPYVIAGGAAVGVIGSALGLRKRKMKKMTLNERGIKRNLASDSTKAGSKSDNYWDMTEEGTEAPKKEDNAVWKDISSDGWTQSMAAARQSPPSATPTNSIASSVAKTGSVAASGASLGADPTARFDAEMQGIYRNAQEFAELGQDSMAIQSYSMLLRLAEKRNDAAMIAFIKGKIDQL